MKILTYGKEFLKKVFSVFSKKQTVQPKVKQVKGKKKTKSKKANRKKV